MFHYLISDSLELGDHQRASPKSANPSEYGYIYSAERAQPPPEVGWKERSGGDQAPVSLYRYVEAGEGAVETRALSRRQRGRGEGERGGRNSCFLIILFYLFIYFFFILFFFWGGGVEIDVTFYFKQPREDET